jgi:hypothetical protein
VRFLSAAGHAWVTPGRCLKCVLYVAKIASA